MSSNQKTAAESVSTLGGFIAGAAAACGAVTFTNPIELVKTRMQLEGELGKHNKNVKKIYKNPAQAFVVIYKNEGVRALQRGLVCSYFCQIALNGSRIGLYEPCRYALTKYLSPSEFKEGEKIPQNLLINVLSGFISGSFGAAVASPFLLVKTRMQSYSPAINIGEQTYYKGVWDGLLLVYRKEGFKGLFRGLDAAIIRTGSGASAQLPVYNLTKIFLLDYNLVPDNSLGLHLISSSMAGLGVAIVMNPWDVVLTRVYNQKGNLYKGPIDCFKKTVTTEGFSALYKGFWAQLLRIGPHSILSLMFMERTMHLVHHVEQVLLP